MVSMPKESMKGKYCVLSSYKQRNKVGFVYLECIVQQDSNRWRLFKLKYQKTVRRAYLETSKQQKQVLAAVFRC